MSNRNGLQKSFVSDVAFTPAVKAAQGRMGSRHGYSRMAETRDWANVISDDLAAFISQRDSLYLGTCSADGQPYIQHRGGPMGFLKVIDARTLAFADFPGNKQYISAGNLSENDRAYIFLMDYENQRRIKIWGRAEFVEGDDALISKLHDPAYDTKSEHALVFHVEAWDVNCPKHIPHLVSVERFEQLVHELKERISELEADNEMLRESATA